MQCFEDMSGLVIDVGSATDRHSLESTRPVFPLVYATTDMYYVTKCKVLFIMEQRWLGRQITSIDAGLVRPLRHR
jgi:hypothetical protein